MTFENSMIEATSNSTASELPLQRRPQSDQQHNKNNHDSNNNSHNIFDNSDSGINNHADSSSNSSSSTLAQDSSNSSSNHSDNGKSLQALVSAISNQRNLSHDSSIYSNHSESGSHDAINNNASISNSNHSISRRLSSAIGGEHLQDQMRLYAADSTNSNSYSHRQSIDASHQWRQINIDQRRGSLVFNINIEDSGSQSNSISTGSLPLLDQQEHQKQQRLTNASSSNNICGYQLLPLPLTPQFRRGSLQYISGMQQQQLYTQPQMLLPSPLPLLETLAMRMPTEELLLQRNQLKQQQNTASVWL